MALFSLRQLGFTYPGRSAPALAGVDLEIEPGAFLVLCGPSGCGKSTLLRQLKTDLTPHGAATGQVFFRDRPLGEWDRRAQTQSIGFVLQSPDNQLVTDKVWHELAFGLESLGLDTPTIRRRVAEMASFFGIQSWFHRDVSQLSGGQKQLLNLAAAMVLQPQALILDEPTAQLDPIAAADFLATLGKLNRDLGTTILLSEHRLEEALPLAGQVAVLDGGRVLAAGTPQAVCLALRAENHPMFSAMPVPARVWAAAEEAGQNCPITVREGRTWLADYARRRGLKEVPAQDAPTSVKEIAITADSLWFRYEKDGEDIVKELSFTVHRGEFLALLGGNGTGKSTVLKLLAGLLRPQRGAVTASGSVGLLPQDPRTLFVKKTLRQELLEVASGPSRLAEVAALCELEPLLDRHPYDLSGGEQQRAALAKVLLTGPDILLLDEPTKGLDAAFKHSLAQTLRRLTQRGVALVMVSHDVEFCAQYAHRCALLFDGEIVAEGPPRTFFSGNSFYTTAANRMARDLLPQAVTVPDLIAACGGVPPQPGGPARKGPPAPENVAPPSPPAPPPGPRRPLSRRSALSVLFFLLLVPVTLVLGQLYLDSRKFYLTALLVMLECMVPFFVAFEGRRPQARELVLLATLCALGVAGRAAFFMLPECKPVAALTVVSGAALGGEAGFLVGAATMLLSNMLLAQGPWTPWQMFAMGLIGFLAGALFRRGPLPRKRWPMALYGALAALTLYGGLLNVQSALFVSHTVTPGILWSAIAVGFPMDLVHALSTFLFLFLGGEAMLDKLERIRTKYGLTT